jgi:hypothetical protein
MVVKSDFSCSMNNQIRLQIYLFLLAVPLHLIWEVALMIFLKPI